MASEHLIATGLLSLAIGVVMGLFGGGGSVLSVPMLLYVTRLEARAAIAVSLFMVSSASAVGAVVHARSGSVQLRPAVAFGLAAMALAFVGGWAARFVPSWLLLGLFATLMLVTSLRMLRSEPRTRAEPLPYSKVRLVGAGAATGLVSGLIGAGGGFLVVPALIYLAGLSVHEAVGTSLLVITFSSAAGFMGHVTHVDLEPRLLAVVTLPGLVGVVSGARLARRVPPARLRRAFGVLVLALGIFLLAQQFSLA